MFKSAFSPKSSTKIIRQRAFLSAEMHLVKDILGLLRAVPVLQVHARPQLVMLTFTV
jgi:hypothetical protein